MKQKPLPPYQRAALTRLREDTYRKKLSSIISLIIKGNPDDTKTIKKLNKKLEDYTFGTYPELFLRSRGRSKSPFYGNP